MKERVNDRVKHSMKNDIRYKDKAQTMNFHPSPPLYIKKIRKRYFIFF